MYARGNGPPLVLTMENYLNNRVRDERGDVSIEQPAREISTNALYRLYHLLRGRCVYRVS